MKNLVFIIVFTSAFFACKNAEKKEIIPEKATITLHVLNGGNILANKLELFSEDTTYAGQKKELVDPFYIISHPKGRLMWDAGLSEMLVDKEPYTDPSGYFTVSRKDSLVNQLKKIGLTVNDFDYLALSHSHFDHVGHAYALKNATWLVQEKEYNYFTSDSIKTIEVEIYNSIKDLKNIKKLNGDYDVFGDGTVVIKSMPGHTIGHQVLYLDLGKEKPILLTGDLYHFEENRTYQRVPMFNYDISQTKKSITAFETFAKETNADVYIQHSSKDLKRLQKLLQNN